MHARPRRAVLRYFAPTDAFVRISILEGAHAAPAGIEGLSRTAYRKLVIQACCPHLDTNEVARLRESGGDDPFAVEDLLYQLCIDVNPQLDIHVVTLLENSAPLPHAAPSESLSEHSGRSALRRRVRALERRLQGCVFGQPQALATVSACLRRAAAGLHSATRPLAALLFVGRTGVGKTELARALSRELFGAAPPARLVRVDCSEYASAHEYAKLIGSPPGYVGHEHGGVLTEALRRTPECVVLFDEVEKAHPRLHHLLLQVLDEGRLTDGRGRTVDFTRSVVCLTSNLGAQEVRRAGQRVGFGAAAPLERGTIDELTLRALDEHFAPEFLARLDERIVFRELDADDARAIAGKLLADLALRSRAQGVRLDVSGAVAGWVVDAGFDGRRGARELGHVIRRQIEAPLADLLLEVRPPKAQRVEVRIVRGIPRVCWSAADRRRTRRAS